MTDSIYKCENHRLDLVCIGCANAWFAKQNKMLNFIKKTAFLDESQEKILALADAGYRVEHVLDARKLLKEIGEL